MNDSGWHSDLLGLTDGRTTWEVNRQWTWTAKASQWSEEDASVWRERFKPKRCFFELPALVDVRGSAEEEGQKLTSLLSDLMLITILLKGGQKRVLWAVCHHPNSVRWKPALSGEVVWRNLGDSQCFISALLLNKTFWGPILEADRFFF